MGNKIERLTKKQEALLPVYRDKWLKIGLSCDDMDVERAKESLRECYRLAGLEPPKLIVVLDSPVGGAIGGAYLQCLCGDQVGDQVRDKAGVQVWNQVGAHVLVQVWDQVWNQVGAHVLDQVGDQVWGQVRDQVWNQVGAHVGAHALDQVGDQVWDQVATQVQDQWFASHNAGWMGWVDYFQSVCALDLSSANGLLTLAQDVGWLSTWSNAAIIQRKHSELHRDDFNRLHNENGMAVKYRDGWGVYCWHGVRTTEQAIMRPETLTISDIKAESDAEKRRVLVERMGYERYLEQSDAKVIDRDFVDIQSGAGMPMPRALVQDGFGDCYLFGTDGSTERCYFMPVPPESTSCRDAHERISGLDESLCVAQS